MFIIRGSVTYLSSILTFHCRIWQKLFRNTWCFHICFPYRFDFHFYGNVSISRHKDASLTLYHLFFSRHAPHIKHNTAHTKHEQSGYKIMDKPQSRPSELKCCLWLSARIINILPWMIQEFLRSPFYHLIPFLLGLEMSLCVYLSVMFERTYTKSCHRSGQDASALFNQHSSSWFRSWNSELVLPSSYFISQESMLHHATKQQRMVTIHAQRKFHESSSFPRSVHKHQLHGLRTPFVTSRWRFSTITLSLRSNCFLFFLACLGSVPKAKFNCPHALSPSLLIAYPQNTFPHFL